MCHVERLALLFWRVFQSKRCLTKAYHHLIEILHLSCTREDGQSPYLVHRTLLRDTVHSNPVSRQTVKGLSNSSFLPSLEKII